MKSGLDHENVIEILLVEDNPQDAELTMRALKKLKIANHIAWVKDGAEALDFIFGSSEDPNAPLNQKAKIVLLDLKLPKVDGHEVLRRLKEDKRTKMIPVVILTSSQEEIDILKTYEIGANSYVVKPLDFGQFIQAVSQLGMYWLLLNQVPPECTIS